jgi:hypothetical protein
VDGIDVIAWIIEQVIGISRFRCQMLRDQREIRLVQPSQQIVVWPVAAAAGPSL